MVITLFHAPGACSRVAMNALEEIGVDYADVCVIFAKGAQKSLDYLALNPKGKVPTLRLDELVITENPVILWHLHSLHPQAGLFPAAAEAPGALERLADLAWFASGLHPLVRQVRAPHRWPSLDAEAIRADGIVKLSPEFDAIAGRLDGGAWWYGANWSIADVYIYWIYSTAQSGGFPLERFPALLAHAARVRERPSFRRSLAREQGAVEREGLKLPPGMQL